MLCSLLWKKNEKRGWLWWEARERKKKEKKRWLAFDPFSLSTSLWCSSCQWLSPCFLPQGLCSGSKLESTQAPTQCNMKSNQSNSRASDEMSKIFKLWSQKWNLSRDVSQKREEVVVPFETEFNLRSSKNWLKVAQCCQIERQLFGLYKRYRRPVKATTSCLAMGKNSSSG